jgi:hypothetical protein
MGAVLAAACASGRGVQPATTPGPYATTSDQPAARPDSASHTPMPPPPPPPSEIVRYGPSALRYLIHRRLHILQTLGERTQAQDLGTRIYVAAAIAGPADSVGYPASFTVDSIVPDSGMPQLVADNVSRARRLVFMGRLPARGGFVHTVASDSTLPQSLIQLLPNFRDFMPRIPAEGLRLGAAWTDTVESTQKTGGSETSRRSIIQSVATAWEERSGARSLRLEGTSTYRLSAAGQNAGQPFELSGSGSGTATAFIAADGRYLGGESHDSATMTIRLPAQGVAVPVIQVTRMTVAVLP